jgi:hypothetical protein
MFRALRFGTVCVLAAVVTPFAVGCAWAETPSRAHNMRLLAHHPLQGRGAYQPIIQRQDGRWIAYVGHHAGEALNSLSGQREPNGTSILDISDPRAPRLLAHLPAAGGAQMVRVCSGDALPRGERGHWYLLRTRGHSAHELWDVSDPSAPRKLTTVVDGLTDTHKSWWECHSGIAYLVSGAVGWRTSRMTQIYDLSDPRRPRHIRDFGLPGQQPGARGAVPVGLHGPISASPERERVYFGYGVNHGGVLQIVDRRRLLEGAPAPTEANLRAPEVGRFDLPPDYGAHTALPVLGLRIDGTPRDYVFVVNEAIAVGCTETRQKVWIFDVTDEARPTHVAWFDVPEGDFCLRGLRFGAHASNEAQPPVFARRLLFFSWFAAGVRAVDIRDPRQPREVGYYIPGGDALTNNVEVDARGVIAIVDRAGAGLHLLELTGPARALMRD